MKKCTKKILLGGMVVLLAGLLISCGGTGNPVPSDEEKIVNLIDDGNADEEIGEISLTNYGATVTRTEGGGVTGNAWKVMQTETEWSELSIELTDVYAKGKSFLVSAKVKNDPDGAHKDAEFTTAWTLYSGDVKNWAERTPGMEYYDYDGSESSIVSPWGGELDVDGSDYGYSQDDFNLVDELSDEWQEIKFIINTSEIERIVNNSGLYKFSIAFYAGKDGPAGYSFLIDDVCVVDLNPELKYEGQTWVDPNAEEETEEPEGTEEEEE